MKTWIKWLLGIFLGIIVVAVLAVGAFLVINRWHNAAGLVSFRQYRFRENGRVMPWQNPPQPGSPLNPTPQYRMPMMRPFWGTRLGGLGPLAMFFLCAIGIGFLVLIVLGVVYLLSPKKPVTVPVAAAVSPAMVPTAAQPTPAAIHTCPHCGRPVQDDWSHCPYCGGPLTGQAETTPS
jgi:hypothetical protein